MPRNTRLKDISPPPLRRQSAIRSDETTSNHQKVSADEAGVKLSGHQPSIAAVEAGRAVVLDHLDYFSAHLQTVQQPFDGTQSRISIDAFRDLYARNQHPAGRHFVVHQHDHPIAGVHYDLRLQFSATSTISFAIPYGLPGNPASVRPNRMAIETRVHNLWNNLIESASHDTGSLLIWDTGEYEILPYRKDIRQADTDDESGGSKNERATAPSSDSERLFASFQDKHIRIRLHGCRLPKTYTISLRLPKSNKSSPRPGPTQTKRRRMIRRRKPVSQTSSESDGEAVEDHEQIGAHDGVETASDVEAEDATIRANNAYTGATNDIGSVHQRHWFLSLDKQNSGMIDSVDDLAPGRSASKPESFYVMGRDVERSVVTGRSADQIMSDEGVRSFTGRKMWRPITE